MYQRSMKELGMLLLVTGTVACEATVSESEDDSEIGGGRTGETTSDADAPGSGAPASPTDSPSTGASDPPLDGGDGDGAPTEPQPGDGDGDGPVTPPPPPAGSSACSSEAPGTQEGDFAENFTLLDQHGEQVSLSDYCGQVVYIPLGAMWCPGCQSTASNIKTMMEDNAGQDFIVLNLMAETSRGETPDQAALQAWADTYTIGTPVLSDADWGVWERYWPEHSTPKNLLIDREGRLAVIGWVGSWDIDDAL